VDGGRDGGGGVVTARTRAVAAALVVVLLVATAFFAFSPAPPTKETTDRAAAADVKKDAPREPPVPRRARTADAAAETPVVETPPADPEPSKWPIRVTTNVPGATVTLHVRVIGGDPDPPPQTTTTDAKGFVGFETGTTAAVARIDFVARAEGWATAQVSHEELGDVTIEMRSGVAVRGRIVDGTGAGVAGATISNKRIGVESYTAAEGSFEAFVANAGPVSFQVQHVAFLPRDLDVTAPASDIVVVLDRGFEVSGRVAFPDGRPLPGAKVHTTDHTRTATTDAEGRYVLSGLLREPVVVECSYRSYLTDETRTVDAGATGVDFVVRTPVARVRFLDAKGRPFRFAALYIRVRKGDENVYSMASAGGLDDDGVHLVPGTPGATLIVTASAASAASGGASLDFDAQARLIDVDVVLGATKPTGAVRLVVRCDSGETPRTVYVTVDDELGNTLAGGPRERFDLDAAGAVEIPSVPAGRVVATVAAAAYGSAEYLTTMLVTARPSVVVETGRATEVTATFVVGGRLRAMLRDENGAAVTPDFVRLLASPKGREIDMFVRRTAEGFTSELDATPSVLIDAVAPGRYVVQTKGPEGDEVSKDVDVVRGETADVVLTVKAKR